MIDFVTHVMAALAGGLLIFVGMSYRHNQLVDQIDALLDELDDRDESSADEDDSAEPFIPDVSTLVHLQNAERDQQRKDAPMKNRQSLRGQERETMRQELRAAYEGGSSIRMLATRAGLTYGRTHKLLAESGVTFRSRGGRKGAKR